MNNEKTYMVFQAAPHPDRFREQPVYMYSCTTVVKATSAQDAISQVVAVTGWSGNFAVCEVESLSASPSAFRLMPPAAKQVEQGEG